MHSAPQYFQIAPQKKLKFKIHPFENKLSVSFIFVVSVLDYGIQWHSRTLKIIYLYFIICSSKYKGMYNLKYNSLFCISKQTFWNIKFIFMYFTNIKFIFHNICFQMYFLFCISNPKYIICILECIFWNIFFIFYFWNISSVIQNKKYILNFIFWNLFLNREDTLSIEIVLSFQHHMGCMFENKGTERNSL